MNKLQVRWFANFLITAFVLTLLNIIFITLNKQYFYNKAQKILNFNAETQEFQIDQFENNSKNKINLQIIDLIKNFSDKQNEKYNVIAIGFNIENHAVVASNNVINKIYDQIFQTLKTKKSNIFNKIFKTHLPNGNHIMVKIQPISIVNCQFSSIMYLIFLNNFDKIIFRNSAICIAISLIILILILVLMVIFIKQTIKPIQQISKFAKKIATTQQTTALKNKLYSHELNDLYNSLKLLAKKLQNSEYAQNEFISSISHELRTPLTAIQGWTETILISKNDQFIFQKGLKIILKEVKRLSKMVEDLLDFTKIKNGHLNLFKEKMDPFAELQEVVLMYQNLALQQEKKLIYKEQTSIPTIFGDKNRIKQIFINIIDNAIKYTNKNDVIMVQAIVSNKTADIIVKDTGKGIAKQHLNHITEKFFKTSNKNKGSGIGLAVVKEIVQKHNGTLNFKSTKNKGTTVTISLPLIQN